MATSATDKQSTEPFTAPLAADQRVASIDILRGFAIFGILVENMLFFGGPLSQWHLPEPWWPAPLDQAVNFAIRWLEEGKFYGLFSFVFGLGVALQIRRVENTGGQFVPLFARRLLTLLTIGLAHAFLFWWGDILTAFAVLGFALLGFRRVSDRVLLTWVLILWLAPVLMVLALVGAAELILPESTSAPATESVLLEAAHLSVARYGAGSLTDIFSQRWFDLQRAWNGTTYNSPKIFLMMLLGLYAGRRGILQQPDNHPRLWRALLWGALPLGLLAHLGHAMTTGGESLPRLVVNIALFTLGLPLATLGYIAAFVSALRRPAVQRLLQPLAAVGQMSLSNYLLQTLVCTTLFYSYGFGLYGKVSPAVGLLPTILLYAGQVAGSNWWLGRFRFGPVEWVWRCATYAQWQRLRRHTV